MQGIRIAIIAITHNGFDISSKISTEFDAKIFINKRLNNYTIFESFDHVKDIAKYVFENFDAVIFIMALGAVVRIIAPYLKDKFHDIPVIVIDDAGRFVIPVISGHHGANELAVKIAGILKATAVITTATDVHGIISIDAIATKYKMAILCRENLAPVSGDMLAGHPVDIINRTSISIPELSGSGKGKKIIITYKKEHENHDLILVPPVLDLGMGFSSDAVLSDMLYAIEYTFKKFDLYMEAIKSISTIDIKSGSTEIKKLAEKLKCPLYFYSAENLNMYSTEKSEVVYRATGAYSVSNAAARITSQNGIPVVSKEIINNVTVSVFLNEH